MAGYSEMTVEIEKVLIKAEPCDSDSEDEPLDRYAAKIKQEPLKYELEIKPEVLNIKCEPDLLPLDHSDSESPSLPTGAKKKKDKNRVTHCDICGEQFRSPGGVNAHKKKRHYNQEMARAEKEGQCVHCGKMYVNRKSLQKHLNKMHLQNNGAGLRLTCNDCGRVFSNRSTLWMHRYTKHSKEDLRRECPHCRRVLKTPQSLKAHIQRRHPVQYLNMRGVSSTEEKAVEVTRPHECPQCSSRFTCGSILKKHVKNVHGASEERDCLACGREFRSQHKLDCHIQNTHSGPDHLMTCLICRRVYKNRSSLQNHTKNAHGLNNARMCGRASTAEEALTYTRKPHSKQIEPECILP